MTTTQTGAVSLPLDDGYVITTVNVVADPARDGLLALIKDALIGDCDSAYQVIKSQINADGYFVNTAIPFDPTGFIGTNGMKFPILALWRGQSVTSDISLQLNKRITEWKLQFIMPQLTDNQMGKAFTFLNAVLTSVEGVIANGYYPSHRDGYMLYDEFGFFRIEVNEAEPGLWTAASSTGDGIMHPAIQITIRTTEVITPYDTESVNPLESAEHTYYINTADPLLYFITDTEGSFP